MDLNNRVTVHDLLDKCERAGTIENVKIAAGLKKGEIKGMWFSDEHLYKTLEAAAFSLLLQWDDRLDARLDSIIAWLAKAREPDGYINLKITAARRRNGDLDNTTGRYKSLVNSLETYCMGHLIEAAVAHKSATGKNNLFELGLKAADHMLHTFGRDKLYQVDGHEEVEPALLKLYEVTGNRDYFDLAKFFIDARGDSSKRELFGPFFQDHMPFIEQKEAVGQAPRATYLYSGAADVAFYNRDPAYIRALNTLWKDVTRRHLYLNGGIGSQHQNEGFGEPYDLPNLTNYTEICAAVSFSMWNTRMFKIAPHAKYFDVFELTLYNNLTAGVSLEGNSYFYPCAMESDGKYKFNLGFNQPQKSLPFSEPSATRKAWFPCPCCPPNLARYIPQIPGYMYAVQNDTLYVNLFMENRADIVIDNQNLTVSQHTRYPWDGEVEFRFFAVQPVEMALMIRIPGWARNQVVPGGLYSYADTCTTAPKIILNGTATELEMEKGYAVIARKWENNDAVTFRLPVKTRRVIADERIKYNRNKTALMAGPVLYCLEKADNPDIEKVRLNNYQKMRRVYEPELLGGTWVVRGAAKDGGTQFTAIPYYKWSNRGENIMKVWLEN